MKINYKIEAIDVLLNKECILERYYPLIPVKNHLVDFFYSVGCSTKNDCLALSNDILLKSSLLSPNEIALLRNFLVMYDVSNQKLKEISGLGLSRAEEISFYDLYLLPGVRSTRASLYYKSGLCSLKIIAASLPQDIIDHTQKTINSYNLSIKAPLVKEANTHIAVAKTFTLYKAE